VQVDYPRARSRNCRGPHSVEDVIQALGVRRSARPGPEVLAVPGAIEALDRPVQTERGVGAILPPALKLASVRRAQLPQVFTSLCPAMIPADDGTPIACKRATIRILTAVVTSGFRQLGNPGGPSWRSEVVI